MPTGSIGHENMLYYRLLPDVVTFGGSWKIDKTALANGEWEALGYTLNIKSALEE